MEKHNGEFQVKATAIIIIYILKADKFQHNENLKPQNKSRWTAAYTGHFFESSTSQKHKRLWLHSDPAKIQAWKRINTGALLYFNQIIGTEATKCFKKLNCTKDKI